MVSISQYDSSCFSASRLLHGLNLLSKDLSHYTFILHKYLTSILNNLSDLDLQGGHKGFKIKREDNNFFTWKTKLCFVTLKKTIWLLISMENWSIFHRFYI